MRLILLRHAKSSWDDAFLSDHDRPLAPRGRRAAKAMRDFAAESEITPELVLTSTAARARGTARIVFGDSGAEIVELADLYMASAGDLLDAAESHGGGANSVAVVAHDPGMHTLASRLVGDDESEAADRIREKYPTGALAEFEIGRSADGTLLAGEARLLRFTRPKDLPRAGELRL